ncbi:hypothetical protein LWI29_031030 [Acer saccharum]|uniref:protein-serine/threonine phosphatase n=1 Tax=Acer saccharum TaxID=4024 RepID=A0AA39RIY1_ACESA|nr:hypothetical protein LWI29_031030 [Acer saccharum]
MGKDVEEGEISDTASIEEISEEDFKKQEVVKVVKESSKPNSRGEAAAAAAARVWTMRDLYHKYPNFRYTPSGLVNFAWAQAVQNKPLNEIMIMDVDNDEGSKRSSPSSSVASVNSGVRDDSKKQVEKVVIDDSCDEVEEVVVVVDVDDEKEEGELEEGEIDMDSELPEERGSEQQFVVKEERDLNNGDDSLGLSLEKRVKSIGEALESVVNVVHSDKSFQEDCLKLQNTLESLKEVINQNDDFPTKTALVQQSFSAVQALNSVFCSMNVDLKEQNKEILSRLLSLLKSFDHSLFSPDQLKEMVVMVSSLGYQNVIISSRADLKEKEMQPVEGLDNKDSNAYLTSKNNMVEPLMQNKPYMSLETAKAGLYGFRGRGPLRPLLDLHKDHDADSLPSPTRETRPCIPAQRVLVVGDDMVKPQSKKFYETDAVKAVSSYQQKFGHGNFYSTDLPSPTPSGESSKAQGGDDTFGEVSSSSTIDNLKISGSSTIENPTISGQVIPFAQHMQMLATARNVAPVSYGSNPVVAPAPVSSGSNPVVAPAPVSSGSNPVVAPAPVSSGSYPVVSPAPVSSGSNPVVAPAPVSSGSNPVVAPAPVSSGSNPVMKASTKHRDPRLRFSNSDALDLNQRPVRSMPMMYNVPKVDSVGGVMSSRKQKSVEEPVLDGPALKRQRNGLENSTVVRDLKTVSGNGGWLEDTDMAGPQIPKRNQLAEHEEPNSRKVENGAPYPTTSVRTNVAAVGGNQHVPVIVPSITASLPPFINDFAVNPTMLMNLLKMGQQQRLATESQQNITNSLTSTVHLPSLNSIVGAAPLMTIAPSAPSGIFPKPMGTLQVPSQVALADESGKVRMKPRDPRRVLHGNTLQRNGSSGPDLFKTNGPSIPSTQASKDNLDSQKQQGQAEAKPLHSQSIPAPDITRMFTKNLKNIADIISASQALTSQPIVSQNLPLQPEQNKLDKTDVKAVISNPEDQRTGTASAADVGPTGPISQNTWGDVEHLFEGYDDQQKAAIQRERAKRLEEQNKMFAAHKLCLVLDLDHTLLNSAKFHEVDPVHHDILRKKEEQDREKPQRHLFRFPHMGMWTKLRPGIWTFLERASKLFELHLYTMGNKLYATEMAKVLDPKGVLFNGRVISKGDDGDDGDDRAKSKDLEGVLGMESSVVIIDDSVRVWPHNKLNLIVVERYTYFPCSRRQFGLPGPSLLEIDHDERPEEGTLASSLAVIERLHQNFFSHQSLDDVDVRNILATEQRKILAGCHILFSRVFPVGEANPHLHPLWQTAEQFGAVCKKQMDDQVTHVVANSLGTDKVNWAISTGRFVVHPGWVEASALLYRRANEQDFAIKP